MYDRFSVSNEAGKYQLFLAGPATGTLVDGMLDTGYSYRDLSGMSFSTPDRDNGDSMRSSNALSGMSFSTPDRDNDRYNVYNCAADYGGGWWFNRCHFAFLNGRWSPGSWYNPWSPTIKTGTYVRGTTMMIRRN
ncbi:ficolin-1-like [Saccostrea cucullata]|uniref:ficolin-1-like n=1 Tax=Saccostrea cuccullata TaxID=36930 RepID=UPI002ED28352